MAMGDHIAMEGHMDVVDMAANMEDMEDMVEDMVTDMAVMEKVMVMGEDMIIAKAMDMEDIIMEVIEDMTMETLKGVVMEAILDKLINYHLPRLT